MQPYRTEGTLCFCYPVLRVTLLIEPMIVGRPSSDFPTLSGSLLDVWPSSVVVTFAESSHKPSPRDDCDNLLESCPLETGPWDVGVGRSHLAVQHNLILPCDVPTPALRTKLGPEP